jgi:hypothetical protein
MDGQTDMAKLIGAIFQLSVEFKRKTCNSSGDLRITSVCE